MAASGTVAQGSPRVLSVFSAGPSTLRAMSNPVDPTEPMEPVAGDADATPEPAAAPAPPPPAPAAGTRGGLVTLAWWWLALGALGCLLLGSLLTFVGTRASDDGPDGGRGGDRMSHQQQGQFGPPQGFGPQGGGQRGPGPGFAPGNGQQFGPPEQFEDQRQDDGDSSDEGTEDEDRGPDDTTDTTDTTEGGAN